MEINKVQAPHWFQRFQRFLLGCKSQKKFSLSELKDMCQLLPAGNLEINWEFRYQLSGIQALKYIQHICKTEYASLLRMCSGGLQRFSLSSIYTRHQCTSITKGYSIKKYTGGKTPPRKFDPSPADFFFPVHRILLLLE